LIEEKFLQKIVDFCREKFETGTIAKSYLAERSINKEYIDTFQIGFCPVGIEELLAKTDPVKLREIGFIRDASYCFFSNYIILPVRDQYGKLIAIAGRILPEHFTGQRKYFNTEYAKRRVLYGLNFAIPEIRRTGEVIVMEGHLDVVMNHQQKILNAVGTCGTAFTLEHMMLLSRYAETIYLLYDADKAGRKAVERVLKENYDGVTLKPIFLPKGEDPDSFLRKYGRTTYLDLIHETEHSYLKSRI